MQKVTMQEVIDALDEIVRAHDLKMGPGAKKLRIERARDVLDRIHNQAT